MEDVGWSGFRKLCCQWRGNDGRSALRRFCVNGDRFNRLSTASARHAGRRAAVVIARRLFVAGAGFAQGHGRDAGQAERQQSTEDGERKANHVGGFYSVLESPVPSPEAREERVR